MRFKDTYVKIGEAVLKHPTQEDIDRRLDSYYKDVDIWTAVENDAYNRVKEFLDKGEDVNVKNNMGNTALIWASIDGHIDIVKLLLEHGADVNVKNKYGNTALTLALRNGHIEIVNLLKQHGAKLTEAILKHPTQEDIDRRFASHYKDADIWTAARVGAYGRVKEFLDSGADVNDIVTLMSAAAYGHKNIVKLLLDRGAKTESRDIFGNTALISASQYGYADTVKLLLDRGADVNARNKYGDTALIQASKYGNTSLVKLLLDMGANVNAKDNGEHTALIWALANGRTDVVELLKQHGAKLNEAILRPPTKEEGEARLAEYMSKMDWFNAAREGYGNVIADKLKQGQDINAQDTYKLSALHYAVLKLHYDIVKLLLEKGADPEIRNRQGITPLMTASIHGIKYAAHQLIVYGADIDNVNFNRNTALMLAVLNGRKYMVEYLMEKGADINARNIFDMTALDIALSEEQGEIASLLEEAGALRSSK